MWEQFSSLADCGDASKDPPRPGLTKSGTTSCNLYNAVGFWKGSHESVFSPHCVKVSDVSCFIAAKLSGSWRDYIVWHGLDRGGGTGAIIWRKDEAPRGEGEKPIRCWEFRSLPSEAQSPGIGRIQNRNKRAWQNDIFSPIIGISRSRCLSWISQRMLFGAWLIATQHSPPSESLAT